ncbi:hypothetical protein [Nostoc sp.]
MAKPLPITKFIAVINNNSVMSRGLILPPNYTIRPAINRTDIAVAKAVIPILCEAAQNHESH